MKYKKSITLTQVLVITVNDANSERNKKSYTFAREYIELCIVSTIYSTNVKYSYGMIDNETRA